MGSSCLAAKAWPLSTTPFSAGPGCKGFQLRGRWFQIVSRASQREMQGIEWPGAKQPPRLELIDDVKSVYDIIIKLQNKN